MDALGVLSPIVALVAFTGAVVVVGSYNFVTFLVGSEL